MPKNIRIKTEVGSNKNLNVKIDQDFDYLEILSRKSNKKMFTPDFVLIMG